MVISLARFGLMGTADCGCAPRGSFTSTSVVEGIAAGTNAAGARASSAGRGVVSTSCERPARRTTMAVHGSQFTQSGGPWAFHRSSGACAHQLTLRGRAPSSPQAQATALHDVRCATHSCTSRVRCHTTMTDLHLCTSACPHPSGAHKRDSRRRPSPHPVSSPSQNRQSGAAQAKAKARLLVPGPSRSLLVVPGPPRSRCCSSPVPRDRAAT